MKYVIALSRVITVVSILIAGCATGPIPTEGDINCQRPTNDQRSYCYDRGYRAFGKDW